MHSDTEQIYFIDILHIYIYIYIYIYTNLYVIISLTISSRLKMVQFIYGILFLSDVG